MINRTKMESKNSNIILPVQLGATALILVLANLDFIAMRFPIDVARQIQSFLGVVGPVLIFGVIPLFSAMQSPKFLSVAKYYLYLSLFSVLIVMNSTFFPFIGGKDYFFRASVEFALICFVLWWGFEAPAGTVLPRIKNLFTKPLFAAVSAFVFVFLLAAAFAVDSHAAFWSNYERGEGGFQMLHYYAFFFLLACLFDGKRDWVRLLWVSLGAAVGMIFYGIGSVIFIFRSDGSFYNPFGFIGPYVENGKLAGPTFLSRFLAGDRFQGSLGNPAYVAPYLLFSFFYVLWLWMLERAKTFSKNVSYGVFLGFLFIFFYFGSQTRGALVGLVAAIFAFLAILALKNKALRMKAVLAVLALTLLMGGLVYFRHTDFVKKLPAGRLLDIGILDKTFQTRLWTWNSAWQGFKERPLLGWGPENFSAVFDKYFDPRHFNPNKQSETWFDYAHSVVFDYLAETGIIGLLSFLGIFAVFFWELARKGAAEGKLIGSALLAALVVGYLVQGLALFNVLPIYLNLFLFMGFACYQFYFAPKGGNPQTP